MRYNTPATRLIYEGGRVAGIAVQQSGEEKIIRVRRGVVLASGGFARSEEARKYIPHEWTVVPRGNTGDGKRMAQEVGAKFARPNAENAIFAPVSILRPKAGPIRRYPHFAMDRSKPGAIIVGPNGRRFTNESEPYQEFVSKMHKMKMEKAWFIADRRFLRKYGMGMALPWPYPISRILRQGYLIKANTIEGLADAIKVPGDALKQTVANMNRYAEMGHDPEFGRGDSIYDQFYGDPHHKPNTNLATCTQAPFYALALYPGNVGTMVGIETNENASALDSQGKVVKGLYAVGCDQNSIVRGTYPAGGCSIGPGMTFGYRAGMHIVSDSS